MGTQQEAREIAEQLLEATRVGLLAGDIPAVVAHFHLPQQIDTYAGRRDVKTPEDLHDVIGAVITYLQEIEATDLVRRVISAGFAAPDTIHYSHESRILSGDRMVQAPYPNFSILKLVEGHWKVAFSQYAITDSERHVAALTGRKRPTEEIT